MKYKGYKIDCHNCGKELMLPTTTEKWQALYSCTNDDCILARNNYVVMTDFNEDSDFIVLSDRYCITSPYGKVKKTQLQSK